MKFILPIKGFVASLQSVALLAILLFSQQNSTAQNAISLTPRNGDALFIGVENPVQVTVAGIPSDNIFIGSDQVDIEKLDNGIFNIRASTPGKVTLTVHGEGFQYKNFDLEVKRILDPLAALTFDNGTAMNNGEMTADDLKKAVGIGFETGGYKGKVQIEIASYNIIRVPKRGDAIEVPNTAANFNEKARNLINMATSGDTFYFEQVKANVFGTSEPRSLNSLVFKIK